MFSVITGAKTIKHGHNHLTIDFLPKAPCCEFCDR